MADLRNDGTEERLQIRIHGAAVLPALVYLPGLHGDWTLVTSFRLRLEGKVRFVEITYPRTLTWSLDDYARAVDGALSANGIRRGWLLGESFSSQVAWVLLGLDRTSFEADGLILAGGFVKYPVSWLVRFTKRCTRGVSLTWLTRLLFFYAKIARFRHRHAPETLASIQEFVARRTELDRQAAVHRLDLLLKHDVRPVARAARLPVFALTGFFDPVVPWPFTFRWLRRNCPGFRASRIIGRADHNVLGTAPTAAARQVLQWITSGGNQPRNPRAG